MCVFSPLVNVSLYKPYLVRLDISLLLAGIHVIEAPDGKGLEYLYSLGPPQQVTASVLLRNFPGCVIGEAGEKDLFSDKCAGEFSVCTSPKLHLGRRLGRTTSGYEIILNAEFDLATWKQSFKKFDFGPGGRDYQRLTDRGLAGFYMDLPVLILE